MKQDVLPTKPSVVLQKQFSLCWTRVVRSFTLYRE